MEPSTGACMSPITSSSEKSTAAMGVLKAAASAADAPTGNQGAHAARAQTEPAAEHGRDARAHLHARTFAAQRDAAGQRDRAEPELAEHGAQADVAVAQEEGDLGLRNAAAARIRENSDTAGSR